MRNLKLLGWSEPDQTGQGRRRPLRGFIGAALVGVCLLVGLPASSFGAEIPGFISTFGAFDRPSGIAVDESTGNVFIADGGSSNAVKIFGADGENPSGVAAPYEIEGFAFEGEPSGLAIDNSTSVSAGALYVADVVNSEVKKYVHDPVSEEYELAESLSASPAFSEPLGVAVDGAGIVFVADYGSESVIRFDPSGTELGRIDVSTAIGSPSSVAIDSQGDLFAHGYSSEAVFKWPANSAGEIVAGTVPVEVVSGGATGIATNPVTDVLYVAMGDHVDQYDALTLSKEGEFGTGTLGATERLAANAISDRVYVTDNGNKTVAVFGLVPAPPVVGDEYVSQVAETEATVNATINPERAETTYHFEYGPTPAYGTATQVVSIGDGSSPLEVQARLTGLAPGTAYHYRVVASNSEGTSTGLDHRFSTQSSSAPKSDCPNQAFRSGLSAALPDCRAYEMVSPLLKNGGDIVAPVNINSNPAMLNQSSISGDSMTYSSYRSFGDALSGGYVTQYLSKRTANGWSTKSISPERGRAVVAEGFSLENNYKAFSPDLKYGWLWQDTLPILAPGAVEGFVNLYRRDNATGSYQAITTVEPPNRDHGSFRPEFQGATPDGSHAVFRVDDALTPDAPDLGPSQSLLYEWDSGQLRLVSVLPDGTPSPQSASAGTSSSLFADRTGNVSRAISLDGSRIFWTASEFIVGPGKIYVRIDGQTTVPVSEAVSSAPARFWSASLDGSKAIFTIGESLYTFDVASEQADLIASSVTGVVGASEDAASVYFTATGSLADGATAGQPNVYLWRAGTLKFIATVTEEDALSNINKNISINNIEPLHRSSRVTPDGTHLAFMSTASLTGYDNTDANTGQPSSEVYLYDAANDELVCVSCNPSGVRPEGRPYLLRRVPTGLWVSAKIPTWTNQNYAPRVLSDDGRRLFFESYGALVPRDTNGEQDVYQWEKSGSGDCDRPDGCLSLISTGESVSPSSFVDASPSGDDVFFSTARNLSPGDAGLVDIYDARVNGGFPLPAAPPPACEGDACQAPPISPSHTTPASSTFSGPRDPSRRAGKRHCRRGQRKKTQQRNRKRRPCRHATRSR